MWAVQLWCTLRLTSAQLPLNRLGIHTGETSLPGVRPGVVPTFTADFPRRDAVVTRGVQDGPRGIHHLCTSIYSMLGRHTVSVRRPTISERDAMGDDEYQGMQ